MPNYKQTSTGAMADLDFSKEVDEANKKAEEAFRKFRSGEGPDPTKKPEGGKQGRMTEDYKNGGSVCGRPTGKGFGKARKRKSK